MTGEFESKTHLLAILDNMPYLAWYKDIDGIFIAINQPFADSIGKPKDEIIGKTDFDVWPQDLAALYVEDDREVIRTLQKKTTEERISDQTGGTWFETFKSPVFDKDGAVIGTMGMARDISKRKISEMALEDQKRFVKSMIDAIPDYIFYKNTDGAYLGCNQAFVKHFNGLTEEDIIGKSDADLFSRTDLVRLFRERDLEVLSHAATQIKEEILPLPDGSLADVETLKTPFFNEVGEVAGLIGISRDITSRKNTERAVKAQSNYLKMLLDTIPSAVYTIDNTGIITSWNEMAMKITGYSAEEVMGKSVDLFLFHPCREKCTFCINKTTVQELNLNCQIQNKNGDIRYLLKNIDALKNEEGEIIGRIECFDDITERVLVEKQLTESEMRLQLTAQNANIGLWDWYVQTGETVFSEQWASIIGYTLEELAPIDISTWVKYAHPGDLEISNQLLQRHFIGESDYYEAEARLKHKDGRWIWVLDRGRVVEWDAESKPIRMVGTHIDITERKTAEEELKVKEKLLSAVALSIKELISNRDYYKAIAKCFDIIGTATSIDRAYLFTNDFSSGEKGFTSQVIEWTSGESTPQLNNPDLQNIPFEDVESFMAPLQNCEAFFGIVSEFKDDRTKELLQAQDILSIIVLPIYVRGLFWGYIGFDECKYERRWTDSEFSILSAFSSAIGKTIERSLVEKELEASKQNAEIANRLKSQFLSSMSHEIRTPLHAILGYTALMKDTAETDQGVTYLNAIHKAGNNLLNLIDDILDLSKIEAGKLELNTGSADLHLIFDDIREIFSLKLQEKKIPLRMVFDQRIPRVLMLDEIRIRQILFNLVGNAVKFTETGSVEVSVSLKDYDAARRSLGLEFQVKDTGIGIPLDQQQSIFEPFKQQDGQNTKKYGGTGLGLSISKRLVELMGGTILLHSEPGAGTTFTVFIPDIALGEFQEATETLPQPVFTQEGQTASDSMTPEAAIPAAPPEMLAELETINNGLLLDTTKSHRISDVRALATALTEIGSRYGHAEIIRYASQLQSYGDTFNLKGIREHLLLFSGLLDELKGAQSKEGTTHDEN